MRALQFFFLFSVFLVSDGLGAVVLGRRFPLEGRIPLYVTEDERGGNRTMDCAADSREQRVASVARVRARARDQVGGGDGSSVKRILRFVRGLLVLGGARRLRMLPGDRHLRRGHGWG